MTRAHTNAYWQQIFRKQDARTDEDTNHLRAANEERAVRAHEHTKQLKLANEELACDLRAINEEAEQHRGFHAMADTNFNRFQVL
jgi:hypothetical protein